MFEDNGQDSSFIHRHPLLAGGLALTGGLAAADAGTDLIGHLMHNKALGLAGKAAWKGAGQAALQGAKKGAIYGSILSTAEPLILHGVLREPVHGKPHPLAKGLRKVASITAGHVQGRQRRRLAQSLVPHDSELWWHSVQRNPAILGVRNDRPLDFVGNVSGGLKASASDVAKRYNAFERYTKQKRLGYGLVGAGLAATALGVMAMRRKKKENS
jgi:hypothetical protein